MKLLKQFTVNFIKDIVLLYSDSGLLVLIGLSTLVLGRSRILFAVGLVDDGGGFL